MTFPLVLYAPNVHQGGGRTLLLALLEQLEREKRILFVLDSRLQLPPGLSLQGEVIRVLPTIVSRLGFEWRFAGYLDDNSRILCMGNLPPLLAHRGRQFVFVQNRYMVEPLPLESFPPAIRFRIRFERWWLRSRTDGVHRWVVQTRTMQSLLEKSFGVASELLPFVAAPLSVQEHGGGKAGIRYDFLYVASGEPHKNHRRLVEAWTLLGDRGRFPSLCLTLDEQRFPELCRWIRQQADDHSLNITLAGETGADVTMLYGMSKALIYPSLLESFGLPLIEAIQAGLPVLSSDRDYVKDIIETDEYFDAESPVSIADAVESFSFTPTALKIELLDARTYLQRTLLATEGG